jgi:hypothetical protein
MAREKGLLCAYFQCQTHGSRKVSDPCVRPHHHPEKCLNDNARYCITVGECLEPAVSNWALSPFLDLSTRDLSVPALSPIFNLGRLYELKEAGVTTIQASLEEM